MRFRPLLRLLPLLAAASLLSSCVTLPGSGDPLDDDAVYRAQDRALRPMGY